MLVLHLSLLPGLSLYLLFIYIFLMDSYTFQYLHPLFLPSHLFKNELFHTKMFDISSSPFGASLSQTTHQLDAQWGSLMGAL